MSVSQKTTIRRNERKRKILKIIRNTPEVSRTLVHRLSGISMDSTLLLIDELLNSGLIQNAGINDTKKVGRKATLLQINEEGCFFLGIRFNANSITGVIINFGHKVIIYRNWTCTEKLSAHKLVNFLIDCINALLEEMGERKSKIRGIGIGAPGIIDFEKGIILRYVHIPDWKDVELKKTLESQFNIPVWVEHNGKCATRALLTLPEHSSCSDMLYMQMDRGIDMCIVVNGQVYNGSSNISGEAGHVHVADNGIRCECGRIGCLETIATKNAIILATQKLLDEGRCNILKSMLDSGSPFWVSTICDAEIAGDADCSELMDYIGYNTGKVIAVSVSLLNPKQFVIAGWMTSSPSFKKSLMQCLNERCLEESIKACQFFFKSVDKLSDVRGAAELPFTKQFGN